MTDHSDDDSKKRSVVNFRQWKAERLKGWRRPSWTRREPPKGGPQHVMQPPGFRRTGTGDAVPSSVPEVARIGDPRGVRKLMLALPAWITPNGVTLFRTVLVGPVLVLASIGAPWAWLTALAVFLCSMALDAVDGALARARGSSTAMGAFYDPLADKIAIWACVAFVPGVWHELFGNVTIFAGIVVAVALTLARIWKLFAAASEPASVQLAAVSANNSGKAKLVTETVSVSLCYLGMGIGNTVLVTFGIWLLAVAVAMAGMSFVRHLRWD